MSNHAYIKVKNKLSPNKVESLLREICNYSALAEFNIKIERWEDTDDDCWSKLGIGWTLTPTTNLDNLDVNLIIWFDNWRTLETRHQSHEWYWFAQWIIWNHLAVNLNGVMSDDGVGVMEAKSKLDNKYSSYKAYHGIIGRIRSGGIFHD